MTDKMKSGVAETFRKLEQAFSSDPLAQAVARSEGRRESTSLTISSVDAPPRLRIVSSALRAPS